jgi:hypothetical protein
MYIDDKYNLARKDIDNGFIALFRGTSMLAETIKWGDAVKNEKGIYEKAYYTHAGLVFRKGDRLLIIDSNANGVHPDFLSLRVKQYQDFCMINPVGFSGLQIEDAVNKAMARAESGIQYNFALLPRIAVARRLGIDLKRMGDNDNRDICSEFTGRRYAGYLGVTSYAKAMGEQGFITPHDHIRYLDNQLKVLFDDREFA